MKAFYSVFALLFGFMSAHANAVRPYYTYIGAGYASENPDSNGDFGLECDPDGWYLNGSLPLNDVVYIHGERTSVDGGGCKTTASNIGIGIRSTMSSNSDLYATAGVITYKYFSEKERGMELNAGVRSMVRNDIELRGYFGFRNIDEEAFEYIDGSFLGAGFSYWFTHGELALTGDFIYTDEETKGLKLGFRLNLY